MPSARIVVGNEPVDCISGSEPFPELLHTPNGTLLVEIQGKINVGELPLTGDDEGTERAQPITSLIDVGEIEFSQIDSPTPVATLVVGQRQKLVGKVVKLPTPLAILKMPASPEASEIPVTQILTHKVIFSDRPEPYMAQ